MGDEEKGVSREVKEALEALRQANGGILTPRQVVDEAAANPASPLRAELTWDDARAADGFRLIEAGRLIARVRVTIGEQQVLRLGRVRVYHPVGSGTGSRPYGHIQDISASAMLRAQALSEARRELDAVKRKYQHLDELLKVWQAIAAAGQEPQAAE